MGFEEGKRVRPTSEFKQFLTGCNAAHASEEQDDGNLMLTVRYDVALGFSGLWDFKFDTNSFR